MKRKKKYTKDEPRALYSFFLTSVKNGEIPSIAKFAQHEGFTVAEVTGFRKHTEFDKAWKEVHEIRRDYLIDSGLTRRFDPSFVKFILGAEFGVGADDDGDNELSVTLRVEE